MVKSKGTGMTKTRRRATRVGAEGLLKQGWSLTFYWCLKGPGHCHHHVGAKYLEEKRSLEGGRARWDRMAVYRFLNMLPPEICRGRGREWGKELGGALELT